MAQPEIVFRIGLISASVFCNEVSSPDGDGKRMLRSANLQRRYRDGDDWKSSTSFSLSDLPAAVRALQLAQGYIESKEAQVKP